MQLPDLHALMLIVWKRFMAGFVLSFLHPELSSACKKESSGPLDLKEFEWGSFYLLLTWFSNMSLMLAMLLARVSELFRECTCYLPF